MFPIKYIDNNLVWNKDNEVFAYYELIPYNYSFLSAEQKFIVLGPMPPRIAKLSNKFRYRLIVKCRNTKGFRSMIETLLTQFPKDARFREVTVYADLNPENIY